MTRVDELRSEVVSAFGLVDRLWRVPSLPGLDEFACYGATYANETRGGRAHNRSAATGSSFSSVADAELTCLAEALERYTVGARAADGFRQARARDLGGRVIDMDAIPTCSARELAAPACRIVPYDDSKPLRWIRGVELTSGDKCWLPAGMANYKLMQGDNERFYFPISTGHAVHTSYAGALVNGLLEVIERDMVAVTWLQQLGLATLAAEHVDGPTSSAIDWLTENFMDVTLFDATSDLGVPIVYALLRAPHDDQLRSWIACAAAPTLVAAAGRAVRELLASRARPLTEPIARPASSNEIRTVLDGAHYMAAPDREAAFGFLSGSTAVTPPTTRPLPDDAGSALAEIVERLRNGGFTAVAVDLTSRELADVGFVAVSICIPELQPMSLWPEARFLGHRRLYELPRSLGHRVQNEEGLNPWPQPFP